MPLDLPADFEGKEKLAKFQDPVALARSYLELEKKLGGMLPAPTSEESKLELMKRLGAPDSPTGYEIPAGVDPGAIKGLQEMAAQARLTPEQFARVAEQLHAKALSEFQAKEGAKTKALTEVQKIYGEGFAEAQARVVKALEAMPPEERTTFNPEDPAQFKLLERMGRGVPAATAAVPPRGAAAQVGFDPMVVAEEARQILSSKAYNDRFHDENPKAKDEYAARVWKLIQAGYAGAYDSRLQPQLGPFAR